MGWANRITFARTSGILRDSSGSLLPMAAASVLVLGLLVGGSVDVSRGYMVKNRLQSACDAGVLAGRRAVDSNGFDTNAEAKAAEFFGVNFNDTSQGTRNTVFAPSSPDNGNTIVATATAVLDTTIMRVFGKDQIDLTVECSASMGVGNADITMVLDTTGSMTTVLSGSSQTRIEALRVAMRNFYTTVDTSMSGGNARIRYALVPYSSSVNVGTILNELNPNFIANSVAIQSREPIYRTVTSQVQNGWNSNGTTTYGSGASVENWTNWSNFNSTQYSNLSNCNSAKPANVAWANNGGSTTTGPTDTVNGSNQKVTTTTVNQPQKSTEYQCVSSGSKYRLQSRSGTRTLYSYTYVTRDPIYETVSSEVFDHWNYVQRTFDTSQYKLGNPVNVNVGTNGANLSTTWAGCIQERQTTNAATFSFSTLLGITPSGASDLDFDSAPGISGTSAWAPQWPQLAYYRTTSSGSTLTNTASSLYGGKANAYCPTGARKLGEMTSDEFGAYADSLTPQGSTYHDIGLIWGARLSSPDGMWSDLVTDPPSNGGEVSRHLIFMTDGIMEPTNAILSSYGIEYHDRRVTSDGSVAQQTSRHTSRFNAVCEAVKAKGIRVWVIVFGTSLTTSMQTCASANSSFTANNAAQLNTAFQEIAKKVGELRVIQ